MRDFGGRQRAYKYPSAHICIWQFMFALIYMSGNNYKKEENQKVETVTERTVPARAPTSAHWQSISSRFVLQSEEVTAPMTEVNVTFEESTRGEMMMASNADDTIAVVDSTPDLGLGQFLGRPVTIDTFTWGTSNPIGVTRSIKPWQLFLNTTVVKNKINNYAFLRGKLHVKVVINATPFQYGLMRACYSPLLGLVSDKIRTNATSDLPLRIPYSQQPGFYIEPQRNAGGEMELPFFYHKNWLDITSNTDVLNMGTLNFVTFASFAVAIATAPTSITVKTIAWMTDVELMGTTNRLALQADEYGNGAISKPATAVANVAGMLTKIPIIGRFARATEIGANAVSKVAALFGYTNPPNISDVMPIYQMSAPHLATAEISVPYQKLTLDPKTELAIDPTPFGLPNQDELALNYLKKKESFFGSTSWSTNDAEGTQMFNARVTPTLRDYVTLQNGATAVVGYRHYDTPLSYLSNMFSNWRGALKIRIKVVCSKYHKGRLKLSWDPVSDITAVDPGLNECYTHILDIGETDEVTLEIPYHQALAWLYTHDNPTAQGWTLGGSNAPGKTVHNGVLTVRVYNTLEAPSTSSVAVLFYVSAGDDFEFSNPKGNITAGSTGVICPVPSFFALQSEEVSKYHCFGEKSSPSAERYGMNYGEAILSLRKLLRRSHVMDTVPLPNGAINAYNIYRKGISRIPYTPGFVPVAWPTDANKVIGAGTSDYSFVTMHMIPYVAGMYLGIRGGINYTLTVNSPIVRPDDIRVIRATDAGSVTATNRVVQLITSFLGSTTLSTKVANLGSIWNLRDGLAGYAVTSTSVAPSVQFTLPDNNNYNFTLSDPSNFIEGSSADGTHLQSALVSIIVANTTGNDEVGYTTLQTAAGAGADFTCLYFLCCPTLDHLVGDPTPV